MRLPRVVLVMVAPLLAIALAVSVASWASGREPSTRSSLALGLDALPRDTIVAGFTDWKAVRDGLGLGRAATTRGRAALTDDASLRDLTTRSVIGGFVEDMHDAYGWSAADLDWESYGRAPSGAAMVGRFADDVSIDDVEDRLDRLGYTRRGDVWSLDTSEGSPVGPELASTLGHLAFDREERLVVAADRAAYVPAVLDTIDGSRRSALSVRATADVAEALAGSDSAFVQTRAFGCRATSFAAADPTVQAQVAAALARTGKLTSPTATGRGLAEGGRGGRQTIRFVATFGSTREAAEQLGVRSALATGPFIGRAGRIEDSLDLAGATVDGTATTLRFRLDPERAAYMTGEGPILFAGCPAG